MENRGRVDHKFDERVIGNCVLYPKGLIVQKDKSVPKPKTFLDKATDVAKRAQVYNEAVMNAFKNPQNLIVFGRGATKAEAQKPVEKLEYKGVQTFEDAKEEGPIPPNALDDSVTIVKRTDDKKD